MYISIEVSEINVVNQEELKQSVQQVSVDVLDIVYKGFVDGNDFDEYVIVDEMWI